MLRIASVAAFASAVAHIDMGHVESVKLTMTRSSEIDVAPPPPHSVETRVELAFAEPVSQTSTSGMRGDDSYSITSAQDINGSPGASAEENSLEAMPEARQNGNDMKMKEAIKKRINPGEPQFCSISLDDKPLGIAEMRFVNIGTAEAPVAQGPYSEHEIRKWLTIKRTDPTDPLSGAPLTDRESLIYDINGFIYDIDGNRLLIQGRRTRTRTESEVKAERDIRSYWKFMKGLMLISVAAPILTLVILSQL